MGRPSNSREGQGHEKGNLGDGLRVWNADVPTSSRKEGGGRTRRQEGEICYVGRRRSVRAGGPVVTVTEGQPGPSGVHPAEPQLCVSDIDEDRIVVATSPPPGEGRQPETRSAHERHAARRIASACAIALAASISVGAIFAHAGVIGDPLGLIQVGTSGENTSATLIAVSNGGCAYSNFGFGSVAVSTGGCSTAFWGIAVSRTGDASNQAGGLASASLGGNAWGGVIAIAPQGTACNGDVSISVSGSACGWDLTFSGSGSATGGVLDVAGTGPASGVVAVSGAGTSSGCSLAVSVTNTAASQCGGGPVSVAASGTGDATACGSAVNLAIPVTGVINPNYGHSCPVSPLDACAGNQCFQSCELFLSYPFLFCGPTCTTRCLPVCFAVIFCVPSAPTIEASTLSSRTEANRTPATERSIPAEASSGRGSLAPRESLQQRLSYHAPGSISISPTPTAARALGLPPAKIHPAPLLGPSLG